MRGRARVVLARAAQSIALGGIFVAAVAGGIVLHADVAATLDRFAFRRIQGSVYVCDSEDMANLFAAIMALKALPWLPHSVRDLRAFRIEQWSDFTAMVKGP